MANRVDFVELLVEVGAPVETMNMKNMSPLQVASEEGHHDIVQLLSDMRAKKSKKE